MAIRDFLHRLMNITLHIPLTSYGSGKVYASSKAKPKQICINPKCMQQMPKKFLKPSFESTDKL